MIQSQVVWGWEGKIFKTALRRVWLTSFLWVCLKTWDVSLRCHTQSEREMHDMGTQLEMDRSDTEPAYIEFSRFISLKL